jgi:uncharacterized protein (DUF2062 family)
VAIGAFSACTPLLGFHIWIALAVATLLRLNRLWAMLASKLPPPAFVLLTFCEIESAHRLRTGVWLRLALQEAVTRGRELVTDWALGTFVVGLPFAAAAGMAAYAVASRWARAKLRTHEGRSRPSSELPPSTPRAPSR